MDSLEVRESKNGKGVFAMRDFAIGETVIQFGGKLLNDREVPDDYGNYEDHYMQVGPNEFLGPSGELDDLINHSCNPNCGFVIGDRNKFFLKAIRPIVSGEETTWDYSTTMDAWGVMLFGEWEMRCNCGEPNCRRVIKDFKFIPKEIRERYIGMGIVPEYIVKALAKYR